MTLIMDNGKIKFHLQKGEKVVDIISYRCYTTTPLEKREKIKKEIKKLLTKRNSDAIL